jgi:hypothetical protein
MIHGSCLCGKVRFALDDDAPQFINHCHCSMCRKVTGAAWGSFLHADGLGFRWLAGESANMPVLEDEGRHVIVPAGGLDDDPGVRPVVHIHCGSKAPWSEIGDALPRSDEMPPDSFWERWFP